MKVMVIVKATKESEARMMPDEKVIAETGKFKEELVKAGCHARRRGAAPKQQRQAPAQASQQASPNRCREQRVPSG